MTRAALFGAVLLLALELAATPIRAATPVRVDDSGTVVSEPVVQMRWRQLVPGRGADHAVDAKLRVNVHLNLARWVNQPVRLYMALGSLDGLSVQASWVTSGRLLNGSLRSGERTLVFTGQVTSAVLEDALLLTLATDGRTLASQKSLQFFFEVES